MKRLTCILLALTVSAAYITADTHKQVVLLTGFSPFGEYDRNVSIESIRPLEGRDIRGYTVSVLELPVSWEDSVKLLRSAMDDLRPRLVIASGIDPSLEEMLVIETTAHNRSIPAADDFGKLPPHNGIIVDGGSEQLSAALPVREILDRMQGAGIPAEAGTDAGSYVCNWLFYYLMHELPPLAAAGFIHIAPSMEPEMMQDIWIFLVREILDIISGYQEVFCFTITQ